jgi:hypothetical protein
LEGQLFFLGDTQNSKAGGWSFIQKVNGWVELTSNVEVQVRQIYVGKIAMVLTPQTTYGHAGTDTPSDKHARCHLASISVNWINDKCKNSEKP